jgi:stalled ribosome rescue protein Dom34
MRILTRKEFQDDMAKLWSEAVEAEYKAQIEAAVLEEREACAKVCDEYGDEYGEFIADVIRSRENK